MATTVPFIDQAVIDEQVAKLRELAATLIKAAKGAGNDAVDAYEKAIASLLELEQKLVSSTEIEAVTTVADKVAKAVESASASAVKAAREVLAA